ncbi:Uncharacterized protein Fot_07696 [Forsythia ovata]|uniref:Uncharacterized protein n=1 Tax=Forsythia ovata TaxID=205694 RepID=A0ABD1WWK1_9LAMI
MSGPNPSRVHIAKKHYPNGSRSADTPKEGLAMLLFKLRLCTGCGGPAAGADPENPRAWKILEGETPHLCQRSLDQTGCKSRDVHEWQGLEGKSQQANPQDRPPQYFSENLPHTKIEHALPEDFSPHHLKPYSLFSICKERVPCAYLR